MQELVQQCQNVFSRAAGATGRAANIMVDATDKQVKNALPNNLITRERTMFDTAIGVRLAFCRSGFR